MPIGVSCVLHVGLITGIVASQHWLMTAAALPPVLPVQLVTLDVAETAPEPPPPAPRRRERTTPPRRIEPPRPQEPPAAARAEPVPPPAEPVAPAPAPQPATAPAPVDVAPAPAAVATLPAISEPASAPASQAPAGGGPPVAIGVAGPAPVAKATSRATDSITRTARPQGGYQVRPAYPSAPRRLGIQGTTVLRVHVLADGRIGDVLVERSAGHPDLDQAATEAVRRWRFDPARRGEEPVAMWVLLPVEFRLTH